MKVPLACSGEHLTAPILGELELPDGTDPKTVAAAQAGYLCEDCSYAWRYLRNEFDNGRPGIPPGQGSIHAADVDAILTSHGKGRKLKK